MTPLSSESTLLVIGGTGFFGKSILDAYLSGNFNNFGITKLILVARSGKGLENFQHLPSNKNFEIVSANVEACDDLPEADYVIHAATSVNFNAFEKNPDTEIIRIVSGVENFARIARKRFTKSKVLYVSSGAVYGDLFEHLEPVTELEGPFGLPNLSPAKAAYALGKLRAEEIMTGLGNEGFSVSIGRPFAFLGKHLLSNQQFAVSNFISKARAGKDIEVLRTRPVFRSYMDAYDLANWLVTMTAGAKEGVNIYNIGSMESLEMFDVAKIVAQEFNVNVIAAPFSDTHADWYIPDTSKAFRDFGLKTERTFLESLHSVISIPGYL